MKSLNLQGFPTLTTGSSAGDRGNFVAKEAWQKFEGKHSCLLCSLQPWGLLCS